MKSIVNKKLRLAQVGLFIVLSLGYLFSLPCKAQVAGDNNVCVGETETYTYGGSDNKRVWTWIGGNKTAGGGLTQTFITINWTTPGAGSVTATDFNSPYTVHNRYVTVNGVLGGSVSGGTTICAGSSQSLSLSGHSGSIVQWEKDTGSGWSAISNTSTSLNTGALSQTTTYRVYISACNGTAYSASATVTVVAPQPGSVSGGGSFCYGGSGTFTISASGFAGNIHAFEKSVYNGSTWGSWQAAGGGHDVTSADFFVNVSTRFRSKILTEYCAFIYSDYTQVTEQSPPPSQTAYISGPSQVCPGSTFGLTLNAVVGSVVGWKKRDFDSSSGEVLHDWGNISPPTSTSVIFKTEFRAEIFRSSCLGSNDFVYFMVNLYPLPTIGTLSSNVSEVCYNGTHTLSLTAFTGVNVTWQKGLSGTDEDWANDGTPGTSLTHPVTGSTATMDWRAVATNICGQTMPTEPITVDVREPMEKPYNLSQTTVVNLLDAQLTAEVQDIYLNRTLIEDRQVIWFGSASASGTPIHTGDHFTDVTQTTYYVRSINSLGCTSDTVSITVRLVPANPPLNVKSEQIRIGNVTDPAQIAGLSGNQKTVAVSYFDGIGRTVQQVVQKGSPSGKDIVQPIVYDQFGRSSKNYLPYAATSTDGAYKSTTFEDQASFYLASNDKVADDEKPYAVSVFEDSPMGRLLEQGSVGTAWQPDATNSYSSTDRTGKASYEVNGASEVLFWTYTVPDATYPFGKVSASTGSTPVYYGANQLIKTRTKDEHYNEVIEYVNSDGKTILKRVQVVAGSVTINDTNYASTYYVYNDFMNLVCVIPPEATSRLATEYYQSGATDATKDAFLKRWAFRYKYDKRGRTTMKQVPGAEPVYLVYDKRDRLVLTQDGNQRVTATKYWSFIKYDLLNRPILTGIKDTTVTLTQVQMQNVVNKYDSTNAATGNFIKSYVAWGEAYIGNSAGNVHGYTNKSYPIRTGASTEIDLNKYLTVTYYDNYGFRSLWPGTYTYVDENLSESAFEVTYNQPDTEFSLVTGQVTGMKTKVLDGGVTGGYNWLKSVVYFDDKYRVIQTISDNNKGGIDRVTNVADFTGKVLITKTTHNEYDLAWKSMVNVIQSGSKLGKVSGSGAWDAGVVSVQQLAASTSGWIEWTVSEANTRRSIGFSDNNTDNNFNTIDFDIDMQTSGNVTVYENGTSRGTFAYATGDILRIERSGTTVTYKRNGTTQVTSPTSSSSVLMADAAFFTPGGTIPGVRSSFSTSAHTVIRRFEYDHAGRLTKKWHQVDSNPEVLLASNEYNELGQLVDKKLHSTNTGTNFKQSVDHRYNIRGWLTSINDSQVQGNIGINTDSGSEGKDLFGMELGYNNSIGTGNTELYNGGISGIKWSRNLGLGVVKDVAYNYSYDPMNRLLGATYKKDTVGGWLNPTGVFNESNYQYDLNGNIKALLRNDSRGSGAALDNLAYDYGSGATASNKLVKVTDNGDITKGFKEIAATGTDYVYDNNGNMLWDTNKGGKEILTNGSFDSGGSNWSIVTDPSGRVSFSGGNMNIANGSGEINVLQTGVLEPFKPYVVVINYTRTAGSGAVTVWLAGTPTAINNGGQTVITATSGNGTNFGITLYPSNFAGSIHSIEVKGLMVMTYNYLNLPETVTKGADHTITYVYDATGRKLTQQVRNLNGVLQKSTDYAGQFLYQNDSLHFINHEEGRIIMKTGTPEYQYQLRDHLGNVRLMFTTVTDTEQYTATLEDANAVAEQSKFLRYSSAKRVYASLFDHTNGSSAGYSERLSGSTNEKFGLARSLSVMPGDTIKCEVFAKYVDGDTTNWTGVLPALMQQITGGASGVVYEGSGYGSSTSSFPGNFIGLLDNTDNGAPKAYLNWLVFDRNFLFNPGKSGFQQISTDAKESGGNISHEMLSSPSILITEPGYVYIYLSNEETTPVEVYFDDLKVTQVKSPVIEMNDYYPHGMQTTNSWARENAVQNNFLANGGTELNTTTGLYDLTFRNYDAAIGRMSQVDPMADYLSSVSPYNYAFNNPVSLNDPRGDYPPSVNPFDFGSYMPGGPLDRGGRGNSWSQTYSDAYLVRSGQMSEDEYIDKYGYEVSRSDYQGYADMLNNTAVGIVSVSIQQNGWSHERDVYVNYRGKILGSILTGVSDLHTKKWASYQACLYCDYHQTQGNCPTCFEGVQIHDSTFGDLEYGAAVTLPGSGIYFSEDYYKDQPKKRLDLLRHEFGHILQARRYGYVNFYLHIAPVSIYSTQTEPNHQKTWTEMEANTLSFIYFNFPSDWNKVAYPINEEYMKGVLKANSLGPK